MPRPCVAEIAYVSSQPRAWNSAPSSSRFSLSALLTATMTGAVARRRIFAASWSAGVMPADRVDDEHDDVGLGDGEPGLLLDRGLDRVVGVELEAAGVDDDEAPAVPLGVAVEAVAGRAGAVLDDGRRGRPRCG